MACDARAVLLVTRQIEGTSTNVARQRIELYCSLLPDHAGPHRDEAQRQEWVVVKGRASMVVRDEDEEEARSD
jgi:mannose-6-phosphate isomerase-like protein (cupin superfamily)